MNRYFYPYLDHHHQNKNQMVFGEHQNKINNNSTINKSIPEKKLKSSNLIIPLMILVEFYQGKCIKIGKDCIQKDYNLDKLITK